METKGNPVDSVIQYQLHRKTEGGGSGDFECKFNGVKTINITKSEDITITSEYYDSLTDFEKGLLGDIGANVGDVISWIYTDIKPNDFINCPFIFCYLVSSGAFGIRKVNFFMYMGELYQVDAYQIQFGGNDFNVFLSDNINSNFIFVDLKEDN